MRGPDLLAWLASLPPSERDARVEEHLGIGGSGTTLRDSRSTPPGEHLIGYHASGVDSILEMLVEVPVGASDVVVDIGSGLGKVVLLAHLVTGATARGIEIQSSLATAAREAALRLGARVAFEHADARDGGTRLDDGTVFFLYLPFTGPALDGVLARLEQVAAHHPIVVCTLGLDLDRRAPWLSRRPLDSFWLAIYDSGPRVPSA